MNFQIFILEFKYLLIVFLEQTFTSPFYKRFCPPFLVNSFIIKKMEMEDFEIQHFFG